MTDPPASLTTFATCSYVEFDPGTGVPCRTTVGHPRFRLRYPLEHKMPEVTPDRTFLGLPRADYAEMYYAKLDRVGVAAIRAAASRVSANQTVVLLCFDKLWLPDAWCHRTMFAEWWSGRTGETVRELGRTE